MPLTLAEANAAVRLWHRHHKSVPGAKFCLGFVRAGAIVGVAIVGVAIVGRPVAMFKAESDGVKQVGISGVRANGQDGAARSGSKSSARKAASARIAKIPAALALHIARTYLPLHREQNS